MKIGAQLYTLHDYCKTLDDFAQTLKRVADMGYTAVQVSGTCDFEAEWLAEQLKINGLVCPLTHTKYDRIVNETEKVIAEHTVFGCDHIGLGGLPGIFTDDVAAREVATRKFAEEAKTAAATIAKAGKLFMYHNHHYEYMTEVDGFEAKLQLMNAMQIGSFYRNYSIIDIIAVGVPIACRTSFGSLNSIFTVSTVGWP